MTEKIINLEGATEEEWKNYSIRETARAVLLDSENKIGVIHIQKYGYYQIVGGGIDGGESIEEGLKRECLEEAGTNIEIVSKLITIKEIQKCENRIQNSYCYIARVIGEKGTPKYTNLELEKGFEVI